MSDHHSWFFTSWILFYLTICKCSDITVKTFEGQNVTLPCQYNSKYHGKCYICWMRGDIPLNGCGDKIISSDGDKVVSRKSARYQMTGGIEHGDVSLTILNVKKTDLGKYGCRIEITGLFNDVKNEISLIVYNATAPTTQETTPMTSSSTEHETTGVITTHTTEADEIGTSNNYSSELLVERRDSVNISLVMMAVLLSLLALIMVGILLIWKKKRKPKSVVQVARSSETSGGAVVLSNRDVVVDNIYEIRTENEYEQY